ncbi:hypothetical protein GCM10009795_015220 [Nocardioides hankookensis]|uniref:Uncharacterized protein n=1 Tax=Nocardioides hankookensis TaxID=443157 RepID=A0ABW1LKD6_9ACTN
MTETRDSAPSRRAERVPSRLDGRLPEIVLVIGLVLQLGLALWFVRGMWFDLDAWGYLVEQPAIPGVVDRLLDAHAGHWSTITYLWYQLLFAVVGMHSYWPYVLATVFLHLAICVVMWWLLVRLGCSRWLATGTVWLIIFLGAGAQGFLWDAAMPPALSTLLGLLALAVVLTRGDRRSSRVVGAVLILLSVMTSGVGVAAGCLVGVYLALEGRIRTAVWVVGPSAVAFVVWYAVYGRGDAVPTAHWNYARLPEFVWTGLTSAFGQATAIPNAGALLLLGVVGTTVFAPRIPLQLRNFAIAGIVAAVLHMTLTGVARIGFGIETASSSRYLYLVLVLAAPAIAGCLIAVAGLPLQVPPLVAVLAVGALLVAYTVTAIFQQQDFTGRQGGYGGVWKHWVAGTLAATAEGEKILTPGPADPLAGGSDFRLLQSPRFEDAVPMSARTAQARLDAESEFFVGVGPDTYDLFQPADITFTGGFVGDFKPGATCNTYPAVAFAPSLELALGEKGNEIGVRSDSTEVTTQVRRDGVLGRKRIWEVEPGDIHIASTAKDADLLVTFNHGGDFTLCTN